MTFYENFRMSNNGMSETVEKLFENSCVREPTKTSENVPEMRLGGRRCTPQLERFPCPNSFYSVTEDVELESRQTYVSMSRPMVQTRDDAYSERRAQMQYLKSRPTSFVILGKPGVGQERLGELVADYWGCVYLEPQALIRNEIAIESEDGRSMEFHLRSGCAIGGDAVLRLLERRALDQSAQHRGFVICGFPLIPNSLYKENYLTMERMVLNLRQTKLESGARQSSLWGYREQLDLIFSLCQMPFLVIYTVCGAVDVVISRQQQKFDVACQREVNLEEEYISKTLYRKVSQRFGANSEEIPEDYIDVVKATATDAQRQRTLVCLPKDWTRNIVSALKRYKQFVHPLIDLRVLQHDPEYYIRVDGRTSPVRMFHAVKQRLSVLSLQKVLDPKRFPAPAVFEEVSLKQRLAHLVKKYSFSPIFKWKLSECGFKCPVLLKEGIERNGDPAYAVQFMNKIFFLANEQCYRKFKTNPRPFLLSRRPTPNYKICVMGPHRSGKSEVSHCLAYLFDCDVLNYQAALDELVRDRIHKALNRTGVDTRFGAAELTANEKSRVLIDGIRKIEHESKCSGRWIVDGMPPDSDLFDVLCRGAPSLLVILLKDENHKHLLDNFRYNDRRDRTDLKRLFAKRGNAERLRLVADRSLAQIREDLVADASYSGGGTDLKIAALDNYELQLKEFDANLAKAQLFFARQGTEVIIVDVADKSTEELLSEVVRLVENRYKQTATLLTIPEKMQELDDLRGIPDDAKSTMENYEALLHRRCYGDTLYYCPVALHDHFALWQGKERFTVRFDNKVYMLSGEAATKKFVANPFLYANLETPPENIPPPRICIVGPNRATRKIILYTLGNILGVFEYRYMDLIKQRILPKTAMSFRDALSYGIGGAEAVNVREYLAKGDPLHEDLLQKIVGPLWLDEHNRRFGFVLDGFPKRLSDVHFMIKNFMVPDVIVETTVNRTHLMSKLLNRRVVELTKLEPAEIRQEIVNRWEERWDARFRELLQRHCSDVFDVSEIGSIVKEIIKVLVAELPKPKCDDGVEELLKLYAKDLERKTVNEVSFMAAVRSACSFEGIPWVTVGTDFTKDKVFAQMLRVMDGWRFRDRSFFERAQEISVDLSEKLLTSGYYFLSKFGKKCPVQVYDGINPIHMYLPLKEQLQVQPVTYRQYIYYLGTREDVEKFKQDPLMYVRQTYLHEPVLPLRVAVIGPPKSGKTECALMFKKCFGTRVISRGESSRYAITCLKCFQIARQMRPVLRSGQQLSDELVIKAVEACTFDGRSATQGFVLDGFPESAEEARLLAAHGLMPHVVIDLKASRPTIRATQFPGHSASLIEYRQQAYSARKDEVRQLLMRRYQNVAEVVAGSSPLKTWVHCVKLAFEAYSGMRDYYKYSQDDVVLKLRHMQITPEEFIQRQSTYKDYCPCCLHFNNALNNGGNPPDRSGLVQFRKHFYYLCRDHVDAFAEEPEKFVCPENMRELPCNLPASTSLLDGEITFGGNCVVCFRSNLDNVISPGSDDLAFVYQNRIYLFDQKECLARFTKNPHIFVPMHVALGSSDVEEES